VSFTKAFATPGHIGDQICFAIKGDQRIIVGHTLFTGAFTQGKEPHAG